MRSMQRSATALLPRYTSYPSMDRFVEGFRSDHYAQALRQRRAGARTSSQALSLYVHIPFCQSLCYFCHCNKTIPRQHRQHRQATAYLRYLDRELDLQTAELGVGQPVSRLAVGGGTPTFLSDQELGQLMALLRRRFSMDGCTELSIEVDPRTVDAERLQKLSELGFNRISFGLQDFDPEVQKAVNRLQSTEHVFDLVKAARLAGFMSISIDLIYGLPRQSLESFERTMALVTALQPDRVALYAYLHEPERFRPQRRLVEAQLPSAFDAAAMHSRSVQHLRDAGYAYLGMDHFSLPHEDLLVAKRHGRLQRDFQGYHSGPDGDLVGLGVSAAGRMGVTYSQNARSLAEYCDLLDQGKLPAVRGLALTRDDLVRRAVIMALMCQGQVSFELIELAYLLDFRSYFSSELAALKPLTEVGWVTSDETGIQVTERGLYELQAVAAVFDRYLQTDLARQQSPQLI